VELIVIDYVIMLTINLDEYMVLMTTTSHHSQYLCSLVFNQIIAPVILIRLNSNLPLFSTALVSSYNSRDNSTIWYILLIGNANFLYNVSDLYKNKVLIVYWEYSWRVC